MQIWQYFHTLQKPTINTPLKLHNSYNNSRVEESSYSALLDSGYNEWCRS